VRAELPDWESSQIERQDLPRLGESDIKGIGIFDIAACILSVIIA